MANDQRGKAKDEAALQLRYGITQRVRSSHCRFICQARLRRDLAGRGLSLLKSVDTEIFGREEFRHRLDVRSDALPTGMAADQCSRALADRQNPKATEHGHRLLARKMHGWQSHHVRRLGKAARDAQRQSHMREQFRLTSQLLCWILESEYVGAGAS